MALSHYNKGEYSQAFNILTEHQNSQYFSSQNLLAIMYLNGLGTQKNVKLAASWFLKADVDNKIVQYNLGFLYNQIRDSLDPRDSRAITWLIKSSNQGYVNADVLMGDIFLAENIKGGNFFSSINAAAKSYNKAAEAGNKDAMKGLGEVYKRLSDNAYASHSEWIKRDALEFDRKEAREKKDGYLGQLGDWYSRDSRKKEFLSKKSKGYSNLATNYYSLSLEWFTKANNTN